MGLRTKKGSPFAIFVVVLSLVALLFSVFMLKYQSYSLGWYGDDYESDSEFSKFVFIDDWELDDIFERGDTEDILLACGALVQIAAAGFLLLAGLVLLFGGSKKVLILPAFFLFVASVLYTAGTMLLRDDSLSKLFEPYAMLWVPCLLLLIVTIFNTCSSIRTPAPLAFFGIALAIAVAVLSLFVGEWFLGQIIKERTYGGYSEYKYIDVSRLIAYCGVMLGIGVGALALTSPEEKRQAGEMAATAQPAPIRPATPVQHFDPMTGRPIAPAAPVQRFDPMTGRPIAPAAPVQRFDPMTGRPIAQTEAVSPTASAAQTVRDEALEEAPVAEHIAAFVQSETEKEEAQKEEAYVEREEADTATVSEASCQTPEQMPAEAEEMTDPDSDLERAAPEILAAEEEKAPSEAAEEPQAAAEAKETDVDYVRVLQQLQQMKELGLINDDEYAAKKAMILEKM